MSLTEEEIDQILEGVSPDLREDAEETLKADYSNEGELIGIESEYAVVDSDFNPVSAEKRDKAIESLDFAEKEVGASMVELVTDSLAVDSLEDLYDELSSKEDRLVENMKDNDLHLVRHGVHPTVEIGDVPMSDGQRYQELVNHFDARRGEVEEFGDEPVRPEGADVVGAICATHLNVTAEDFDDAVEKANYLTMIQPWAMAMSGNSRIVEGKDTGYNSTRMSPMWEVNYNGVDNPQRHTQSGMADDYHEDIGDYLQSLSAIFPKDPEEREEADLVENGNAERWKDDRIKFYTGEGENENRGIVVEGRLGDNQPTAEEEIAYHGFLRGRLAYAQENDEPLIPIENARHNRDAAIQDGLDAEMFFWGEDGDNYNLVTGKPSERNLEEIKKAKEGLQYLGVDEAGYFNILEERLENGTPSDRQAEEYSEKREYMSSKEALSEIMPFVGKPEHDILEK